MPSKSFILVRFRVMAFKIVCWGGIVCVCLFAWVRVNKLWMTVWYWEGVVIICPGLVAILYPGGTSRTLGDKAFWGNFHLFWGYIRPQRPPCTYIYVHTEASTHIKRTDKPLWIHTFIHIHTHIYAHTYPYIDTHMYTHCTHLHIHINISEHIHTDTHLHTYSHTRARTYKTVIN